MAVRCFLPVCTLVVLALVGCGEPSRNLPKAKATGTVTYDGKPLPGGTVVFQHETGEMASAPIGSSGEYSVEAAEGKNKVMVQSAEPERENPDPNGMPRVLPGKSRIPDKYNNFASSGLSYDLKPGENKIDIQLAK